jgi:hypothetical protein
MTRDMREIGPLAILLFPIIAIGTIGCGLLRLILGPSGDCRDYEYQY